MGGERVPEPGWVLELHEEPENHGRCPNTYVSAGGLHSYPYPILVCQPGKGLPKLVTANATLLPACTAQG